MVRIAITPILRSVVCCIGVQALTSYNWFGFIAALPQRFQINNLPSFWCLMPLVKSREAIHLIWSQIYAIWPTYEYTDMYMYHSWFFFFPKLLGVQIHPCTSTGSAPTQSDGQTERVNQCLKTYLRCFVHACPTKWSQWLPLAEFWYNTSYHSTLGKTPFVVLYGREPRQLGIEGVECCQTPDLQQWLQDRSLMQQLLQQHLLRAQKHMKSHADKKRTDRSFEVGDFVYLKLQPYVQSSIAQRSSNKLAFRYFGPFKVLSRIGLVAYKLQLPEASAVHPVFHVSLLTKFVPVRCYGQNKLFP